MTIHNPNLNSAQNIYNAPTQPQYAAQSRNRTIPLNQAQSSVHASANLGGTGVQPGAAQNVNVSGGVGSNSGGGNSGGGNTGGGNTGGGNTGGGNSGGGTAGHGGSAQASGQIVARSSNRGQSLNNGGGNANANANRGGASRNTNTGFVIFGPARNRNTGFVVHGPARNRNTGFVIHGPGRI
ncbi:hypothetical protein BOTCAL_0200g00080 [Botryotinia calthae]|uniref:Uncharacterized protein n=1 Tax=Botryotinia calthae TaxID=38488 RepID=A0A4Y8CZC2_9HELO|nr:hypothetical protein BOTCAL_0200g00080 [Botryotinia calthae]